jgi:hypothetical protein
MSLTAVTFSGNDAGIGGAGGAGGNFAPLSKALSFAGQNGTGTPGGRGGALFNAATAAQTVQTTTFADNAAGTGAGQHGGDGGAIFTAGPLTIEGGSFSDNAAGTSVYGPLDTPTNRDGSGGSGGAIAATAPVSVNGATFSDNEAGDATGNGRGGRGGAIATRAALSITGGTFSGNSAGDSSVEVGQAAGADGGNGGAIAQYGDEAVGLTGVTLSGNVTGAPPSSGGRGGDGGALWADGRVTITGSTLSGNATAPGASFAPPHSGRGGAVAVEGSLTITGSALAQNATGAGDGGGGAVRSFGDLTIRETTLSGNSTTAGGGAAIEATFGEATLVNDTITGNTTGSGSGAVLVDGRALAMTHVTLASNATSGLVRSATSGPVTVGDSILASNTGGNCSGAIADGGNNLSFPASDTSCPGGFGSGDPVLGALADNGGPTKTMRLGAGSAALDAASGAPPPSDQRGIAPAPGNARDIGAFERAAATAAIVPATGVTSTAAAVAGTVDNNDALGGSAHFEYGPASNPTQFQTAAVAVPAKTLAALSANLADLAPSTEYSYRLVLANGDGTVTSAPATFTTGAEPAGGGGGGGGGTTAVPRPEISILWISNAKFAVKGSSRRIPHRTTLHFTLSEAATTAVTLERIKRGKATPAGSLPEFAGKTGANRQSFNGRVDGKALRRGKYRATMVATNAAGIESAPASLTFKIVR